MNGHERFLAALRCEEVDKLPSHWHGPEPAGLFRKEFDVFLDLDDNPELEACFEISPMGDMTVKNWFSRGTSSDIGIGAGGIPWKTVYYNPDKDWYYTHTEAKGLPESKKKYQITMYGEVRQYGYQLGKEGERLSTYWWFHKHFFEGPDALERVDAFYNEFGAPWEVDFDPSARSIEFAKENIKKWVDYGAPHAYSGHCNFHFEGIWGGFGPVTIVKLARKNPSKLREICKQWEKVTLTVEQYGLEAGHEIMSTGDDLGQKERSLVSPKLYKEFFYPALKARCDLAHKHGAVIWMHSCGFQEELVPFYLEAGLDGLQSLEVPAGNDLGRIRSVVRDKMCLIGGLDTSRVLTFGTPAEADAHVRAQIKAATYLDGDSLNTGYIPGGSHDLLDVKLDNIQAAIRAIAKYGRCPIAL
ncbi:MAG: uroporphyrinogen decarboxylase family protein [Promethearchaeota archaeon]